MKCLYVTADKIGEPNHGGGSVTYNELNFLRELGETDIINPSPNNDPFVVDEEALNIYKKYKRQYDVCHIYSGCFSKLVDALHNDNCKVSYMAAAHSISISKSEHEKFGHPYNFPHLTDPILWKNYLRGYASADCLITTSTHSKETMESFGCTNRIELIPHGIPEMPKEIKPIPKRFHVGYLGGIGFDKGLIYLLQAWKMLNYKNAHMTLAGRDTPMLFAMVRQIGGGAIHLAGFAKDISKFYNSCSVYVQYSSTEGFGLEILESMAHGRPVISSTNNCGPDLLGDCGIVVPALNAKALADVIDIYKNNSALLQEHSENAREKAKNYTWDKIKEKYLSVWRDLV